MGTSETILTIGALMLLSLFSLTLNSHMVYDHTVIYHSEQVLEAIGQAQLYIEEAENLRFDEDNSAQAIASYTEPGDLGPDSGESYGNFDDVDDFNGFSVTDSLSNSIPFTINISVHYVDPDNDYRQISTQSYYKEISVTIDSDAFSGALDGQVILRKLYAYHYFFTE